MHTELDQKMKLFLAATLASSASAFASVAFTAWSSALQMVNLDYGKQNSYAPAKSGDGGQGTFGAVSPSNWRVPGTSPIAESLTLGYLMVAMNHGLQRPKRLSSWTWRKPMRLSRHSPNQLLILRLLNLLRAVRTVGHQRHLQWTRLLPNSAT